MLSKRDSLKIFWVLAVHLVLMIWARYLIVPSENIPLIWLPDGFLLACYLLTNKRLWIYILLAVSFSTLIFEFVFLDKSTPLILTIVTSNAIESYGSALVFSKLVKTPTKFNTFRNLVVFFLICVIFFPSISATVIAISVAELYPGSSVIDIYRSWILVPGLGIFFFTPLILYIDDWIKRFSKSRLQEYFPLFIMTGLVIILVVCTKYFFQQDFTTYLIFGIISLLTLIYCSIRYGIFGAIFFSSLLVISSFQMTALGFGPFVEQSESLRSAIVKEQIFMILFVLVSMFTAIATEKFRIVNHKLEKKNKDLIESRGELNLTNLALTKAHENLQTIVESIPGAVFECNWDDKFSMNYLSPYIEIITGYKPDEFYPKGKTKFIDIINKADIANMQSVLSESFNNRERYILNYRIKTKKRQEKWIMENGEFFKENNKNTIKGVIIDITKQVEVRKNMLEEIYRAEDMTRHDLSRDLHEDLQQALVVAKMNIEAAMPEIQNLSESTLTKLNTGFDYIQKSLEHSVKISQSIVPKTIKEEGLYRAINQMIDDIKSETIFRFQSNIDSTPFDETIELGIYRITQECINNIVKHAQASEAIIQLNHYKKSLTLTVEDDGVGFDRKDITQRKKGFGFKSIKSRTEFLGGYFEVNTSIDRGTIVLVEVPTFKKKVNK